jgi:putative membrane protein
VPDDTAATDRDLEDAPTEEVARPVGRVEAPVETDSIVADDKEAIVEAIDLPEQRLHPASLWVNLIPRGWATLRGAWPWLLALFLTGSFSIEGAVELSIVGVIFLLSMSSTVVHYLTLRYRVSDGWLFIRSGLIQRRERSIPPQRIQNIERVRNVFYKASGLVEVRIETASGTEVEGLLSALTVEDADRLIGMLELARRRAHAQAPRTEVEPPALVTHDLRTLLWYGATETRVGLLAFAAIAANQIMVSLSPDQLESAGGVLGMLGAAALLIALLSGAWLVSMGSALLRHWGFRLVRRDQVLVAEEGLLTRRKVELPVDKVQLVAVREPLLRRLAGFGSVLVETAAARAGSGGTQRAEALVPVVLPGSFQHIIRQAIPTLDVTLHDLVLRPPHARALVRALIRACMVWTVLASVVTLGVSLQASISHPALLHLVRTLEGTVFFIWLMVPITATLAWLDWRYQGWWVSDEVVVARRGFLSRRTTVVSRGKLQSTELIQGPFLRRYDLGVLVLRVAGSSVVMPVLQFDEAYALQQQLLDGLSVSETLPARSSLPTPEPTSLLPASPPDRTSGPHSEENLATE